MKKGTILIIIIAVVAIWGVSQYNGLVSQDETVEKAWNNVQTQYQRRADLIPNLVNTVKGYAQHEKETFEAVVNARAKATQITIDASDLTAEKLEQFQKAQSELSSALGKLMAVSESYPELKASEQFSELQAQLEGTENRIQQYRETFNAEVRDYNVKVRKFPMNILAGMFGFERKSGFEAEAGAEKAPEVKF